MTIVPRPADLIAAPPLAALQQHPSYARTLAAFGRKARYLTLNTGTGRAVGLAQVFIRRIGPARIAWVPRGPLWHPGTARDDKRAAIARLGAHLPRALWLITWDSPEDAEILPHHGRIRIAGPQTMAEIDLTRPAQTRLHTQHGKWRNRLRAAENAGLFIESRPLRLPLDRALLDLELTQRRARRYSALPARFTTAWARLDPQGTRLFIARKQGTPIAYILLLLHAPTATYHIGWSDPEGRHCNAHNLLLWRASNWLAAQGYARLDLGAVDHAGAPGLARFKQGSGADLRMTGPTHLQLATRVFRD